MEISFEMKKRLKYHKSYYYDFCSQDLESRRGSKLIVEIETPLEK
jgi:hypothetical protein